MKIIYVYGMLGKLRNNKLVSLLVIGIVNTFLKETDI